MLNIKELEEMGKKAGFSYVALLKSDSIQLMPEVRHYCPDSGETGGSFGRRDDDGDRSGS